jgi:hypothetical protein
VARFSEDLNPSIEWHITREYYDGKYLVGLDPWVQVVKKVLKYTEEDNELYEAIYLPPCTLLLLCIYILMYY